MPVSCVQNSVRMGWPTGRTYLWNRPSSWTIFSLSLIGWLIDSHLVSHCLNHGPTATTQHLCWMTDRTYLWSRPSSCTTVILSRIDWLIDQCQPRNNCVGWLIEHTCETVPVPAQQSPYLSLADSLTNSKHATVLDDRLNILKKPSQLLHNSHIISHWLTQWPPLTTQHMCWMTDRTSLWNRPSSCTTVILSRIDWLIDQHQPRNTCVGWLIEHTRETIPTPAVLHNNYLNSHWLI